MPAKKKKAGTEKIPAVIYARYSSASQRDESIEGQIRECTDFADRHGFRVVGHYEDRALTGRTDKRPGFQKMIADSDKKQFQAVICWKTDRFARNRYDAAIYKARLKKNGVRLYYARESVPEGPEGIILESVMEGFAEYYSANLSENVKRGYYDSALQYKTLGKRVLGYRTGSDGRYEIDPNTAPVVKRIFQEYDAGRPMIDICTDLNADGFKTMSGNAFNKSSLNKILKNEKYIGVYRYRDIYAPDGVPALIDRDMFERVAERLKAKAHAPRAKDGPRFLLTSKLFCGHCGEPMVGDSARGEHGKLYYYYLCNNRKKRKCDKKREKKDDIEAFVTRALIDVVMDDEFIETMADLCIKQLESDVDRSELRAIEARQKENQRALDNFMKALETGLVSKTVNARIAELEAERDLLEEAYAREMLKIPDLDRDQILFMLEKLRSGDVDDRRYRERLVDTFLNSVYLYDDGKMVMHLNFIGENDTVTLEYTNALLSSSDTAPLSQLGAHYPNSVWIGSGYVSFLIQY